MKDQKTNYRQRTLVGTLRKKIKELTQALDRERAECAEYRSKWINSIDFKIEDMRSKVDDAVDVLDSATRDAQRF